MPKYLAHVFGKGHGCSKCSILKQRLTALLEKPEYGNVRMVFHDVLTVEGLMEFLKAEVLNPSRIPGLLMSGEDGDYLTVDREALGMDQYKAGCTGHYLGVQTDYSHGGVISPDMIRGVLDRLPKD